MLSRVRVTMSGRLCACGFFSSYHLRREATSNNRSSTRSPMMMTRVFEIIAFFLLGEKGTGCQEIPQPLHMLNRLQDQIRCLVQKIFPAPNTSLFLLKDAENVGCGDSVGRSGDGDGLIELAQVDERVHCGR